MEIGEGLCYHYIWKQSLLDDFTAQMNEAVKNHSWYFRNALVRANYNDLKNDVHATTKDESESQSVNCKVPKVQNDTLEEIAVLKLIAENPAITQKELLVKTGKSLSTIKRIMASLQEKEYIRRVNGKRYGKWKILVEFH